MFDGTGCEAGFCPGEAIDRKTMAVWVVRVLDGRDPSAVSQPRFDDVEAGGFHAAFIERMAELEVTTGCGDGSVFCPDRNVTRAQMAVFISRAFDLPDGPDPNFSDVPDDAWYAADVARLAQSRITTGCGDGTMFCPGRDTNRGQIATFLWRAENPDWQAASRTVEDESPGVFLTEENELSRFIRHEIVENYADEHPWLMEVWNYTNRPGFEYRADSTTNNVVYYDVELVPQGNGTLYEIEAIRLEMHPDDMEDPWGWPAAAHEMAHVYTYTKATGHPEAIAAAWLYFDHLAADGQYCSTGELYADTAQVLVNFEGEDPDYDYTRSWQDCGHLPSEPTEEAVEVARSAFAGETPQWFYDTFQNADGSLNSAA